ncbi:hypothetical protein MKQ70_27215 [Chitinophaga sedimenti]|uniref:hypothetical protein n=1 Tax=Chitinophaga sedimenti TaxID=2033606 RepID=UPI002002E2AF|nr:hypothetical protein [Chitinophaga sedimenti]MCK7558485.1 hypothetical protein [Chitinophaga sedimenti]
MNKQQKTVLWSGLAAAAAIAVIGAAVLQKKRTAALDEGDLQRKMFRREHRVRKHS